MGRFKKTLLSVLGSPFFWVLSCMLAAGIASNMTAGASENGVGKAEQEENSVDEEKKVMREGTRIESQVARCQLSGERLVLSFESFQVIALENLATQRMLKAMNDDPNDVQWQITGEVTEFQGQNYLYVHRVTRASKSN
ncbi:MAG: hypothetical protein KDB03_23610 [Planctomycetales bacterium]|nr:hypothetical protein [Planctomycetales bacterium]